MKPGGKLSNFIVNKNFNMSQYALEKLENDYLELEKNNFKEKEDGDGASELRRNSDVKNGQQRGYSSGRSSNLSF